ncbi:MAG: MaoC/PaaZ C-terminal domain-containing protein [Pseudomonadota bacterium]
MKYFEDFEDGFTHEYSVLGLTVDEIKEFAERYDPQRFHLDEEEASKTHFGGLVASGFQTQLLCFKPFCDQVLLDTAAVGAPGIDNLKWLRPWYPNQDLDVVVTMVGKRFSSKRTDRGYLTMKLVASADGESALTMDWSIIVLTRQSVESP